MSRFHVGQVVMVKTIIGSVYPVKLRKRTNIGDDSRGPAWMDTLSNVEYENEMRPLNRKERV